MIKGADAHTLSAEICYDCGNFGTELLLYLVEYFSLWYELWNYSNKMAYFRKHSPHIETSVEITHKENLVIAELIPN